MDVLKLREYEGLSPFEIKDFLAKAASKTRERVGGRLPERRPRQPELDRHRAARGVLPARAVRHHREQARAGPAARRRRHAAGAGHRRAIDRLARQARGPCRAPGSSARCVPWAVQKFGFDADKFVHELVDSIIGDNYPVPDRMLVHNEQIVHEYLQWAMCGPPRPKGQFKLYAVEGGTAAMCYIFKSMKTNRLLNAGDTIALGTPIFTPYLEMPHLEDYDLKVVNVQATQENRWQFDDEELKKLLDPAIKAFFLVNPGNPSAVALSDKTIAKIGAILKKRPDLILLTDDVYGTFVPGLPLAAGRASRTTRSASIPTASTSAAPAGASA